MVERLLDREKDNNGGKYPETIALVLWGTDNIKTYGESLAQVMMMVGIRPVPDALGRVNKLEVMSLEELGRPRIDVVVNCSGARPGPLCCGYKCTACDGRLLVPAVRVLYGLFDGTLRAPAVWVYRLRVPCG